MTQSLFGGKLGSREQIFRLLLAFAMLLFCSRGKAETVLPAPSNLQFTYVNNYTPYNNTTHLNLNLTWKISGAPKNILVMSASSPTGPFQTIATLAGTATQYTVSGLSWYGSYYYQVEAQYSTGTSLPSNTAAYTYNPEYKFAMNVYTDVNGAPGTLLGANASVHEGDAFFLQITAQDLRANPNGLAGLGLSIWWNPNAFEEIDSPFDPLAPTSALVTQCFPAYREGELNNATGLISNLGGFTNYPLGPGCFIGKNGPQQFSMMHFRATSTVQASPFDMLDTAGVGFVPEIHFTDLNLMFQPATITVLPAAPAAPSAPTALATSAVSPTQIALSWSLASGNNAQSILVLRSTSSSGPFVQIATLPGASTAYSDSSVMAATTYFYQVEASNGAGVSPASNKASVTTPAPSTPAAPSNFKATAVSSTQINLSWTNTVSTQTIVGITRNGTLIQILSGNPTSFSDTGLQPGTTYAYSIQSYVYATNGLSPFATASATTLAASIALSSASK